ncbi:13863_t:CDS:2, partial [Entrophospora sp. SA101]
TEYCCPEAGRYFKGENDTKILKESGIKSPKMLKDMFVCLGNSIDHFSRITNNVIEIMVDKNYKRIVEILRQMKNSDISEILVSQHEKQGWIINVDKSSFILLK